ncbi:predicted protein [Lodderomyces elongisporus NRRL YB-4239]|uniref:Uncharacterized protein n=1 Tax=Lodderomyces elongisporus (strain ATCC 11503 / CBS 2605 / JCM 1781 / NBRC 1676 / NRRL YB-4239) TaxID=379508 RepID=A5E490_LODEL|nr:predicted protein [Lodderomyces elongisporus NRRL YB-4239]
MKPFLLAIALSLSSTALAAVRDIELYAISDDKDINGQNVYVAHTGRGVHGFYLSTEAQRLQFDDKKKTLLVEKSLTHENKAHGSSLGEVLNIAVGSGPLIVEFEQDGTLLLDKQNLFEYVKNTKQNHYGFKRDTIDSLHQR